MATTVTTYLRHYIPKGGMPGGHPIICPRCLNTRWVVEENPHCANCDYIDLIDHSTCLDGNCCNAL